MGREKGISRFAGLVAAAALLLIVPGSAAAAVITPNTTVDQFNSDAGSCSLREAVASANNDSNGMSPGCIAGSGADMIQLAPGTYELTIPRVADNVESGDLEVTGGALTVAGLPGGPVTIDANQTDRLFQAFAALTIDGITLTGGFVDSPGPGIATTGGAIASSGGTAVTLTDSAVVNNRADGSGGGLNIPGPLTLTNVTISGNVAVESGGGGIQVSHPSGALVMDHITVTNNVGISGGSMSGGLHAGGVALGQGTATIHNSIVAGNTENSTVENVPNCQLGVGTTFTSNGGNIFGTLGTCSFTTATGDEVNVTDLDLAPLGDYGGPSLTHALTLGSTAIDNGVATCQPFDQRGIARSAAPCEAGAYEVLAGDTDGDSVLDGADNCQMIVNADQANTDGDPQGDACDPDDDNDTVLDGADNCQVIANADQANNDGDAQGDVCDPDDDNDAVLDVSDNCPTQAGPGSNGGCPVPVPAPVAQPATTTVNPLCAPLRKKLKAAKKRGDKPKVRKLRRKLRRLGC